MYEKCRTVFSRASDAFDQGARPESPSATHGNEPVAALRPCEFVGGLGNEETSSRTERMTQRNGATVGVDARHIGPDLLSPGQHHRSKGLVYFHDVDIVDRETNALEQPTRGRDRPFEHQHRIAADERRLDNPRHWLETELAGALTAHQQHRGSAVGNLR